MHTGVFKVGAKVFVDNHFLRVASAQFIVETMGPGYQVLGNHSIIRVVREPKAVPGQVGQLYEVTKGAAALEAVAGASWDSWPVSPGPAGAASCAPGKACGCHSCALGARR